MILNKINNEFGLTSKRVDHNKPFKSSIMFRKSVKRVFL